MENNLNDRIESKIVVITTLFYIGIPKFNKRKNNKDNRVNYGEKNKDTRFFNMTILLGREKDELDQYIRH
jgi:hypothetical protein